MLQEAITEIRALSSDAAQQYYVSDLVDGSANFIARRLLYERGTFDKGFTLVVPFLAFEQASFMQAAVVPVDGANL